MNADLTNNDRNTLYMYIQPLEDEDDV